MHMVHDHASIIRIPEIEDVRFVFPVLESLERNNQNLGMKGKNIKKLEI